MGLTQVNSGGIEDGSIVNADIKSDSAIALTKLASTPAVLTGSTNNTIATVTGANAIAGEANLTFDGDHLTQTIDASGEGINQTAAGNHYIENLASANRSSADGVIWRQTADWNGKTVAQVKMAAGSDTTNKDDGYITFWTSAANDNAERVSIDSSGNVGINESASNMSNGKLTVKIDTNKHIGFNGSQGEVGSKPALVAYQDNGSLSEMGFRGVDIRFATGSAERGRWTDNGLTFNGDTAAANGLDDYEEGTFTPLLGGSNYGTYNITGSGKYTKIGRQVNFQIQFTDKNLNDAASGGVRVRGFPYSFSVSNTSRQITRHMMTNNVGIPDNGTHCLYGDSDGISMHGIYSNDASGWTSWSVSDFHASGLYLDITGSYMTS